eukprot:1158565-Pelagomonas_calceolata.AAC.9
MHARTAGKCMFKLAYLQTDEVVQGMEGRPEHRHIHFGSMALPHGLAIHARTIICQMAFLGCENCQDKHLDWPIQFSEAACIAPERQLKHKQQLGARTSGCWHS